MECVELHALGIIQRDGREVAEGGTQRIHAWDDPELRKQREYKHQADQHVSHSKDMRATVGEATVEQGTRQKDDSGNNGDPMQFTEGTPDYISSEMRIWQKLKRGGRKDESKKDQTTDPSHKREQHEEAQEGHDNEL
jgi:hypothetical protein